MHTSNLKLKTKKSKLQFKIKNFKFYIVVLSFAFSVFSLLGGCIQKTDLQETEILVRSAEAYYQDAVAHYKALISKGKNLDKLYLELGKLYFQHGKFEEAIGAFQKSASLEAKKFLAISYYRLGNFTDALEIFNKEDIPDDEYLYYRGLTCEKLNLFDQALEAYGRIRDKEFLRKAQERIESIEKRENLINIKELAPDIYKIIAGSPGLKQYPQAGALILSCDEKIELNADGTKVSYLHYLVKILNERGKEDFSETHIDYDSTYEKIELEYARTIRPDGAIVDVGSRHIRDVSKYLNFPIYSNARVYIISFPEISEGAVIEYKLKIRDSQRIHRNDFVLNYGVQTTEPILQANFILVLPKEKALRLKIINEKYNDFGANLIPEKEEGRTIYRWQFKNIPQIIPESNMPPLSEVNTTLRISTFESWQDVYNWWWKLAREKIKADSAIKDKVRELLKDKTSQEDKIRAIYNFCAKEIRYVAIEYGQAGYEPHKAADTFRNKYGDCKDKAILLITMLKEAGISAWPVLISTRDYYDLNEDVPSISFNHAIAALVFRGKTVFMDTTAETCSFGDLPAGDQARKVLIFREDSFQIEDTPLYLPEHNLIKQDLYIKINPDETILAKKIISSLGVYDQGQRYWLLYTQPELIEESLKQKIQDISIGAKLIKYNIENLDNLNLPVALKYSFQGPEFFTPAGNLRIMPQIANLDTSFVAKDKRKYPIEFGFLDTKEMNFEFEIPSNLAIMYMPESIDEESPWLKFRAQYSRKDNKLYFKQKVQLKKEAVSESEYPDFKIFVEGLAKRIKQRIVLQGRLR